MGEFYLGKGIVRRWLFNYLSVTILLVILIVCAASFAVRAHYYGAVKDHLEQLGQNAQQSYLKYDGDNTAVWVNGYLDGIVGEESVDVAASSATGEIYRVVADPKNGTSGSELVEYISESNKETNDEGVFRTENLPSGEKVLSYSVFIRGYDGKVVSVLRFCEPLEEADGKVGRALMILVFGAFVLLAIFVVPTLLFMQTIVKPVRELRACAHRIAQGDYETRVEKKYDDEIGELAESINHMAEEIKNSENMKNDFISSISHELRTPLTSIKGWSETMLPGCPDNETMKKGLGVISSESERLTGMVEELLDFSRLQSGHMVLVMDKCDLLAELGEAVYMLRQRAEKEGKHFVYEEPEYIPPVLADKNRLRQVFINIIDNALKYTPVNGVIGIEVKCGDENIKVTVSDTGCGINERDLPHIKEKFYKANKTVRGSGIGLAVADDIIQRHKGRLDIESKEDVGTTVTITIPILDDDDQKMLKN